MAKKLEVKRIEPLSVAKILGILYAAIGLILGLFITLASLLGASGEAGVFGVVFGVAAIVLLPVFYGAMGFIVGGIIAWLYNLVAKRIGGIRIETK